MGSLWSSEAVTGGKCWQGRRNTWEVIDRDEWLEDIDQVLNRGTKWHNNKRFINTLYLTSV